jgi:hypothetical protein
MIMTTTSARVRASEAIPVKAVKLPPLRRPNGQPTIKVSDLVKRRHEDAIKALARAIEQREAAFAKLVRVNNKIWQLARQVQRYEKLTEV